MNPKELICIGAEMGLGVMALTDHDTVGGLSLAAAAAKEVGVEFVAGIELTISWPFGEFHLLGLGLDLEGISPRLLALTELLKQDRLSRNMQIIEKMRADGFDVSYEELAALAGTECVGRPHFAQYFVEKGFVKSRQQAFDLYIARDRPYYVGKNGCDLDEAIAAIRESGGAPVLAHPLSLYLAWGKLEAALKDLRARGVCGIEAWHPAAREAECRRLEALGKELGFFVTAGSDFHGKTVRADRFLGYTAGHTAIADRFWTEELKPWLDNLSKL